MSIDIPWDSRKSDVKRVLDVHYRRISVEPPALVKESLRLNNDGRTARAILAVRRRRHFANLHSI